MIKNAIKLENLDLRGQNFNFLTEISNSADFFARIRLPLDYYARKF